MKPAVEKQGLLIAQILRFGVVGLATTAVNGCIYWIVTDRHWARPLSANAIGFALAFLVSFLGHWRWTFASPSGPAHGGTSLQRFLVTALAGFAFNSLATWWLTGFLALPAASALPIIVLITPILLFIASKHWAFAKKREPADKPGSV